MKQQNIDFKEIDKDVLGTDSEFKVPPESSSWQAETCSLFCAFNPITMWNVFNVSISNSNMKSAITDDNKHWLF